MQCHQAVRRQLYLVIWNQVEFVVDVCLLSQLHCKLTQRENKIAIVASELTETMRRALCIVRNVLETIVPEIFLRSHDQPKFVIGCCSFRKMHLVVMFVDLREAYE